MVTKKQFIISCVFNGGNVVMLLYYIYDIIVRTTDLEHITRWSYYLNSIFTTICIVCDTMEYISQKDKEKIETQMNYNLMTDDNKNDSRNIYEKLDNWNRNEFGVICNTLCYFVSIGFWSLFFLGNSVMQVSKSIKNVFNCVYHHIIIQIIVLVDIFIFKRKRHAFSWFYFGIIYAIFVAYSLIIFIEKFIFGRNAYFFMEGSSKLFLLICFAISSLLLYVSYLLHIYLIELKHRKFNKDNLLLDDEEKENNFIEEDRF